MSKLVSVALAAAAAMAVVSTSTPLFAAGPAQEYKTAAVRYRDLDLATAAGQKAFDGRVRAAVREVCGTAHSSTLKEHASLHKCRTAAFKTARPQVERALAGYQPQVIIAASR